MPSMTCKNCGSLVIYSDGVTVAVCPKCGKEISLGGAPTTAKMPVAPMVDAAPGKTPIPLTTGEAVRKPAGAIPTATALPVASGFPSPIHHHAPAVHRARGGSPLRLILGIALGIVLASIPWLIGITSLKSKNAELETNYAQLKIDLTDAQKLVQDMNQDRQQNNQLKTTELQAKIDALSNHKNKLVKDNEDLNAAVKKLQQEKDRLELQVSDLLYEGHQPANGSRLRPGVRSPPPASNP